MNDAGQVYFDVESLIPEADRKRLIEAEERERAWLREVLNDDAADRLEQRIAQAEDKMLLG